MIKFFRESFIFDGEYTLLFKILLSILTLVIAKIISLILNRVIKKIASGKGVTDFNNTKKINSVISILSSIIKYIIYFIAIVIILSIYNINTSSLIATAGIGGIVIAFGVQSIVKDLFNGIFILLDDQYNVGDDVIINGIEGEVLSINIRNTVIKGYNGSVNTISNGTITTVTNISKRDQRSIISFYFPIDSDIGKIKNVIIEYSEIFKKENTTVIKEPSFFGIADVGLYYIKVNIAIWSKASFQWTNEKLYREGLLIEFIKRDIKFLKFEEKGDKIV